MRPSLRVNLPVLPTIEESHFLREIIFSLLASWLMWKLNLTFHFPEKPVKRHYGYGRYGGSRYGGSRYGGSRYGGYRSRYYGKK